MQVSRSATGRCGPLIVGLSMFVAYLTTKSGQAPEQVTGVAEFELTMSRDTGYGREIPTIRQAVSNGGAAMRK